MADVKQIQQIIPHITCEIPFGSDVCELVFGVDIFDMDLWIQVNSVEQPVKSNSVGSGDVSHCRTSAFNDHLDYSFIVLQTYSKASWRADWTFEGTASMSCITLILL